MRRWIKKIVSIGLCISVLSSLMACSNENAEDVDTQEETYEIVSEEQNTQEEIIDEDTVDLTILSSTMVYAEVYNMLMNPSDYIGKTVRMEGEFIVLSDDTGENIYPACIIYDATACCAQGIEFVLGEDAIYPDDYPELNSEIVVVGTFETYDEYGIEYVHLVDAILE